MTEKQIDESVFLVEGKKDLSLSYTHVTSILHDACQQVEEAAIKVLREAIRQQDRDGLRKLIGKGPLQLVANVATILSDQYLAYFNALPPEERTKKAAEIMKEMKANENKRN